MTINVTDADEPPGFHAAQTVTASYATVQIVRWTSPAISDYDYRYRVKGATDWSEVTDRDIPATSASISGLSASIEHELQMREAKEEGTATRSDSGTGSTGVPAPTNTSPVAVDETASTNEDAAVNIDGAVNYTDAEYAPLSVTALDTRPSNGTDVIKTGSANGEAVAATNPESETLTYTLIGTDTASFAIDPASGELRTVAPLNDDTQSSDEFTVEVTEGNDGDADAAFDNTIATMVHVTRPSAQVLADSDTRVLRTVLPEQPTRIEAPRDHRSGGPTEAVS